jgi:hypothetical protein
LLNEQGEDRVTVLTPAVPNIYAVSPRAEPVPWVGRILAALVGAACLGVLLLAASLTPNPSGFGTHSASLGLAKCNFLATTGIPCPSCGMTTAWTWMTHGNLLAAAYVQPMGAVLCLLAAACVWGGFYVAIAGRPVHRLLRAMPARYTLVPLLLLGILAWGWKILIHLSGVDGWH